MEKCVSASDRMLRFGGGTFFSGSRRNAHRLPRRSTTIFLFASVVLLLQVSGVSANDPLQFVETPENQRVVSDRVASFTCLATGNPEPQIKWRKNGSHLESTIRFLIIDVPEGSILRIEPVKYMRDEGTYECVAENRAGYFIEAKAKLEVLSDDSLSIPSGFPYFRTEPRTKAVEVDHTALLVCDARGNPEPKITWYKDQQPVDMANPRYTVLRSGSLQIRTSTEEDRGKYECVAENDVGTAFSRLVNLYVRVRRVPPQFTKKPDKIYEMMPGESLEISCIAVGSPMPYVQWKKGKTVDVTENQIAKNVLSLKDIKKSDNYTCVAQSTLGIISAEVQVKVQALPRPPTSVQISGITPTSVRMIWSYDVNPSDVGYYVIRYKPKHADRDFAEISGLVTMFFTVIGLTPLTNYEFRVLAVNKIGPGPHSEPVYVTTSETDIAGNSKPVSAPRNVHVRPLSSSTIVVQWEEPEHHNGHIMGYKLYYTTNPSLPIQYWKSQPVQDNKLTTISDLTPHTIYTLRVQAYTVIGPGSFSDPVKVKTQRGVPSQSTNLHPSRVTATSIELSWTRPSHQGENIIAYELYWNDTHSNKVQQITIPEGERFVLGNSELKLRPNTVYTLWLAAKSQIGEGAATAPISVRTEQDTLGAAPQEINAFAEDSKSIRVQWKPPLEDEQHGDITYYKLMYVNRTRPTSDAFVVILDDPNQREYLIQNLFKWTEYKVWMLAGTMIGDGMKSEPISVRTDEDVPGEPRNVKVEVLNSTSAEVSLTPPSEREQNGIIRVYRIHVQELGNEQEQDLIAEPETMDNRVPAIGKAAPAFKGTAVVKGEFKDISLAEYKGKYVVLFFYPLDFTFVCPTEIIAFSERAEEFRNIGCELIAVSTDSHFSHLAWINTDRKNGGLGQMDIPLLADKNMKISKSYGVLKEDDGIAYRGLFIIDTQQQLRQITMNDLPVGRDVDETLRLVQAFQFTDKHGEVCPAGWKPGAKTMKADPKGSKAYFASQN